MEIHVKGEEVVISGFDEIEVLKIAMKIEADGNIYYQHAYEKASDERMKRTFKRLAEDELKHLSIFKNLYESELKNRGIDPASVDSEEDLFTYIETGIFMKEKSPSSVKDAIISAGHAEIRTINFYKGMLKDSKIEPVKKVLAQLIEEEQMHYNIIKSWEAAV
jgi:rubrerythrin